MIISPSIASSDVLHVADEVFFADQYCRQVHLDVEDGVAVMGITFGMKMCKKIKKIISRNTYLSLHLEVYRPLDYLEEIQEIEPDIVFIQTNHLEDPISVLKQFREAKIHTGISISDMDIADGHIEPLIAMAEQALVLTAGLSDPEQRFQMDLFQYASELAQKKDMPVWIDGGVTLELYKKMEQLKTSIYAAVMGRGVFRDKKLFLDAIYGMDQV